MGGDEIYYVRLCALTRVSQNTVSVSASTSKLSILSPASSVFFTTGKHDGQNYSKTNLLV